MGWDLDCGLVEAGIRWAEQHDGERGRRVAACAVVELATLIEGADDPARMARVVALLARARRIIPDAGDIEPSAGAAWLEGRAMQRQARPLARVIPLDLARPERIIRDGT